MKQNFARFIIASLCFVISIIIIFIIILANTRLVVFREPFLYSQLQKENVPLEIKGYSTRLLLHDTLIYLKGEKQILETPFFSPQEKAHLADVRGLIEKGNVFFFLIAVFGIVLIIILRVLSKKSIFSYCRKILIVSSSAILVLSLLIFIFPSLFLPLFELFHEAFFIGNWQFAAESNIITLFPEQFFSDVFERILLNSALMSFLILMILTFMYLLKCITDTKRNLELELALIASKAHDNKNGSSKTKEPKKNQKHP